MPRPSDCISCTACVLVCPAEALDMATPAEA
jgi:NAD-dependent dihydropyrimidine dehydrogenase PreA subunit